MPTNHRSRHPEESRVRGTTKDLYSCLISGDELWRSFAALRMTTESILPLVLATNHQALTTVILNPFAKHDPVLVVHFAETNCNCFGIRCLKNPSHVIRLDGQLPVPAVDQDAEFHSARSPVLHKGI